MKEKIKQVEKSGIIAEKTTESSKFSFAQWFIDSHNLKIYTARGSSSPGISLGKILKYNQAPEW